MRYPRESIMSRRKMKKRLFKYVEALTALKAYGNSEMKVKEIIDNVMFPNRSRSHHCQVPHCGMAIRYEYVMVNKTSGDEIVVGSTCVWEMLGLSKEQIKEFGKFESTVKEFHKMLAWKKDNQDVYAKVKDLEGRNVKPFEPFWNEVKYTSLGDWDTEYIRNLDVDAEEKRYKESLERIAARRNRTYAPLAPVAPVSSVVVKSIDDRKMLNDKSITYSDDAEYVKVLTCLDRLIARNSNDGFLISLRNDSNEKSLTFSQMRAVKLETNRVYYEDKVKDDPIKNKIYMGCEFVVEPLFLKAGKDKDIKVFGPDLERLENNKCGYRNMVNKYRSQFNEFIQTKCDADTKYAWMMYRIKHAILIK
jgi:hypothetical protein